MRNFGVLKIQLETAKGQLFKVDRWLDIATPAEIAESMFRNVNQLF